MLLLQSNQRRKTLGKIIRITEPMLHAFNLTSKQRFFKLENLNFGFAFMCQSRHGAKPQNVMQIT